MNIFNRREGHCCTITFGLLTNALILSLIDFSVSLLCLEDVMEDCHNKLMNAGGRVVQKFVQSKKKKAAQGNKSED